MKELPQEWVETSKNGLTGISRRRENVERVDLNHQLEYNSSYKNCDLFSRSMKPLQFPLPNLQSQVGSDSSNNGSLSFIEEFDNTNYLNASATTASGWGSGSIQLGLAGIGVPISRETLGSAMDVHISGDYAYIADWTGLTIINISDPINPGTPIHRNATSNAWDVYVSGNYCYLAYQDQSYIAIIDISDPTNPSKTLINF
ncbi:MAG: hypothetical protein JSW11_06945 [Candidatus Heimdallarchaeota archaeon]|nr:MAG: hypothetical protein JSW11_06945 [Candidatus Heimdallarchaeota archaeon]